MKKAVSLALATALTLSALTGCSPAKPAESAAAAAPSASAEAAAPAASASAAAGGAELTVVTSYGGDDGNRGNYEAAVKAYEDATGNKIADNSGTSNETWKAQVLSDFQTGSEPDVLFFFSGADSNEIVKAGKVVDVETIKAKYPEYANNMNPVKMPTSPADNKLYAIPVNGYWEAMFTNKKVLEAAGVKLPDATYTWDQFLKDCKTIAAKGVTPVAASMAEVPHYWFEYAILNHDGPADHTKLPASGTDAQGKNWIAGLNDIKAMYDAQAFPKNTLTAKDEETFQAMFDGKAAFALDGSWKVGGFESNVKETLGDYTVVYPPAQGTRKATDLIGGTSMGYYITKKAWDDPAKQAAAVKFVEAMTTDAVVSQFSNWSATALTNPVTPSDSISVLGKEAVKMVNGATSFTPAVQDSLTSPQKTAIMGSVQNIVTGSTTADKALADALAAK